MTGTRRVLAVLATAIISVTTISGLPAHADTSAGGALSRADFEQRLKAAQDDWVNAHATEAIRVESKTTPTPTRTKTLSGVINPDGTLLVTDTDTLERGSETMARTGQTLCAVTATGTLGCFYRAVDSASLAAVEATPWSPGSDSTDLTSVVLLDAASDLVGDIGDYPDITTTHSITANADGSSTYATVYGGPSGATVTAATTIGVTYAASIIGEEAGAEPTSFFTMTLTPSSPQAVPAAPTQLEPGSRTRSDLNALAKTIESFYTDKGYYPRTGRPLSTPMWDPSLDPNGIYRMCYNRGEAVNYVILGTIPGAKTYWVYDSSNGGARETADMKVNGKLPKCSDFDLPNAKGKVRPARPGPVLS